MLSPPQFLKRGNFFNIMLFVILYALAFFVAITMANTLSTTVKTLLPDDTSPLAETWIVLAFSLLIFALVIYILITIMGDDA